MKIHIERPSSRRMTTTDTVLAAAAADMSIEARASKKQRSPAVSTADAEPMLLRLAAVWTLRSRDEKKLPRFPVGSWYQKAGGPKAFKPLLDQSAVEIGSRPPLDVLEFSRQYRPLARALRSAVKGQAALVQVQRLIGILDEPTLLKAFGDPPSGKKPGKKASKADLGRWLNDRLTIAVRKGSAPKQILQQFDRDRGTDLARQLNEPKVLRRLGFLDDGTLTVDGHEVGSFKGQRLRIQRLAVPGGKVNWNHKYDPASGSRGQKYVMSIQPANSKAVEYIYFLHHGQNSVRQQTKNLWSDTDDLTKSLPQILKQVQVDLKSADQTSGPMAAALAFVYLTACRIGSKGDGTQTGGIGALTLTDQHIVAYRPGKLLQVRYSGKGQAGKNELQEHRITGDLPVGRALLGWLQKHRRLETVAGGSGSKKRKTTAQDIGLDLADTADHVALAKAKAAVSKGSPRYLFPVDVANPTRRLTPTSVNRYLQKFTSATVHKFRKIRGTLAAKELLKNLKPSKNMGQKEVEKLFIERMAKVGKILGHYTIKNGKGQSTGRTAISSYIEPSLMVDWFKDHGYKVPDLIRDTAKRTGTATD